MTGLAKPPAGLPARDGVDDVALPAHLREDVDNWLLTDQRAGNTQRAYQDDWRQFSQWLHDNGYPDAAGLTRGGFLHPDLLPVGTDWVVAYVKELVGAGKSMNTVRRRVSGIGAVHTEFDHPDPTKAQKVRKAMGLSARQLGTDTDRAAPLTWDLIVRLVDGFDRTGLTGARDAALLLVGFGAALRRSELSGLDVADLTPRTVDGVDALDVLVRRSKTDQTGTGAKITVVSHTDPHLSVTEAVDRWTSAAEINHGPLFRGVSVHGAVAETRFHPDSINRVIRRMVRQARFPNWDEYSAHSLRSGWATSAANVGVPQAAIQAHGRWKTQRIAAGYQHAAGLASVDAGRKILGIEGADQ